MFEHLEVAVQAALNGVSDVPVLLSGVELRVEEPSEYVALVVQHPRYDPTVGIGGDRIVNISQVEMEVVLKDKPRDEPSYSLLRRTTRNIIDFMEDLTVLTYSVGDDEGFFAIERSVSLEQRYDLTEEGQLSCILTFEIQLSN